MYNDPKCKPWTSNHWAPAGYTSRYDLVEQTKAAHARKPLAPVEEKQIEHAGLGKNGQTTGPEGRAAQNDDGIPASAVHNTSEDADRTKTFVGESGQPGAPGYDVGLTKNGPAGGMGEAHRDGHGNGP
mgnify:CR=1 FL=1